MPYSSRAPELETVRQTPSRGTVPNSYLAGLTFERAHGHVLTARIQPAARKPGAEAWRTLHHEQVKAVPELRGDRIGPSAHTDNEAAAHAAGEDEETARRFGWWPAHSTEETVRAAYANWARNWRDDGPTRAFAARDPETGALVGGCELRIGPDSTGEVSYWTHGGKRGRGHG